MIYFDIKNIATATYCFHNHQLVMKGLCVNYTLRNQFLDFRNKNNSALLKQSSLVSRLFKIMCNTLSVSQIHDFNLWQQLGSRKVDIPQTIVEQCALVCKCIQSIGCGLIFHFLTAYFHFHFLIPQTIVVWGMRK